MSKKNNKVALAIIAKDEISDLVRIIKDYGSYFDSIYIAYDSIIPDLENELDYAGLLTKKVKIYSYLWRNDFAHKRNFIASKVKEPYYVRMDTDDILIGAENIVSMVNTMHETSTDIVMCYYKYNKTNSGHTDLAHYRETIIRNDKDIFWKKAVHENINCTPGRSITYYKDEDHRLYLVHDIDDEHKIQSMARNLNILMEEYEKDGDDTDPRTLAYLGRTFCEYGDFDEALKFLALHVEQSGWDEDRYLSYLYIAEALEKKGHVKEAKKALFVAIDERPDFPAAYAKMCELYFEEQDYHKAIDWGTIAYSKPIPNTNLCFDPTLTVIKVPFVLAVSYVHIGDYNKAVEIFRAVEKIAPDSELIVGSKHIFDELDEQLNYLNALLKVIKFTKKHNVSAMADLVSTIPEELSTNEMVNDLRVRYLPHKIHGENDITIYCGQTTQEWSPASVEDGVGGSEEACIHMARSLQKLGYNITVYSTIDSEYDDGGILYIPYQKFPKNDQFNILIGWRNNISNVGINAKRHIVWLHDFVRPIMFQKGKCDKIYKIIVLSEYHKSMLPEHVQKFAYISTNGINPADFDCELPERQDKRMIWASSYDRGLEDILLDWPKIREAEPEAEIHIFYGWNLFDDYAKQGICDPALKVKMLELFKQDGVFEHGKIGHKELIKEYLKSSVYAYPCSYPGEINCIALTKAIATNCNVITNDRFVMAERSPNKVEDDKFTDALLDELKKPVKEGLNEQYISDMSWDRVAKSWNEDILK
jgi:tetratricopeptide (TPR) repeat protein